MKNIQYLIFTESMVLFEAKTRKEMISKVLSDKWYILPFRQISMANGFPCYQLRKGRLKRVGTFDIKYHELSITGIQFFCINKECISINE